MRSGTPLPVAEEGGPLRPLRPASIRLLPLCEPLTRGLSIIRILYIGKLFRIAGLITTDGSHQRGGIVKGVACEARPVDGTASRVRRSRGRIAKRERVRRPLRQENNTVLSLNAGRRYKGGDGEFPSFEGKLIEVFKFLRSRVACMCTPISL